jgi:hypothetical protein
MRIIAISIGAGLLAACGGSQPPIGAPGTLLQSREFPSTSQLDLLYVSAYDNSTRLDKTYVFNYANRTQLFTLSGVTYPSGVCVGKAGNVFVADDAKPYAIVEYRHGATKPQRRILVDEPPFACAVDHKSGDIAVTTSDYRNFYVYKHGRGNPEMYTVPNVDGVPECSYDSRGRLFLAAWTHNSYRIRSYLYEFHKASDRVHIIRLKGLDHYFFDVKWDGTYVAILSEESIYRLAIAGKHGKVEQTVRLPNQVEFWVVPSYSQAVSTDGDGNVEFVDYPSGDYITEFHIGNTTYPPAVSLAHPST